MNTVTALNRKNAWEQASSKAMHLLLAYFESVTIQGNWLVCINQQRPFEEYKGDDAVYELSIKKRSRKSKHWDYRIEQLYRKHNLSALN